MSLSLANFRRKRIEFKSVMIADDEWKKREPIIYTIIRSIRLILFFTATAHFDGSTITELRLANKMIAIPKLTVICFRNDTLAASSKAVFM